MRTLLEYLKHGRNMDQLGSETHKLALNEVIASFMMLDPFYKDLIQPLLGEKKLGEFSPWQYEESRKDKIRNILDISAGKFERCKNLIEVILLLPMSATSNFNHLTRTDQQGSWINYYTHLIRAHCLHLGVGIPKNVKDALAELRMASVAAPEKDSEAELNVIVRLLDTWFESNDFEVAHLKCELLENCVRSRSEPIGSLEELERLCLPALETISKNIDIFKSHSKIAELRTVQESFNLLYMNTRRALHVVRIQRATRSLTSISSKLIEEDPIFQTERVELQDFFEIYLNYCQALFSEKAWESSAAHFQVHFNLSRSPRSAMRLAEMAANGLLGKDRSKPVSDFTEAARLYDDAMSEAIVEGDMVTFNQVAANYKQIEKSVPEPRQINLRSKVIIAIKVIAESEGATTKKHALRRESVKIRHKILDLKLYLTEKTISLITSNDLGSDLILQLKEAFLTSNRQLEDWFLLLCRVIPVTPDLNQPTQDASLQQAFKEVRPQILQSLNGSVNNNINGLYQILSAVIEHRLYLLSSDIIDAANNYIGRCMAVAALNNQFNELYNLKPFFEKKISPPFLDRSLELNYWLVRTRLEQNFTAKTDISATSHEQLKNIYELAIQQRKGVKQNFAFVRKSFMEQLKEIIHPEAYLKVAQLIEPLLSPSESHEVFIDFGHHIIKAMTCAFTPGDSLGIYANLGFRLIDKLHEQNGHTDKQKDVIHFYYALALLIKDPVRFKKEITGFFGKTCGLELAKAAISLVKNNKLLLSLEVKRILLHSTYALNQVLDSETVRTIKKLATDNGFDVKNPGSTIAQAESTPGDNEAGSTSLAATMSVASQEPPPSYDDSRPSPINPAAAAALMAVSPEAAMVPIKGVLAAAPSEIIDDQAQQSSMPGNSELLKQLEAMRLLLAQREAELADKQRENQALNLQLSNKEALLREAKGEVMEAKAAAAKSESKAESLQAELTKTQATVRALRSSLAQVMVASKIILEQSAVLKGLEEEAPSPVSNGLSV